MAFTAPRTAIPTSRSIDRAPAIRAAGRRSRAGLIVRVIVAAVVCVVMIFPFYVLVVTAFTDTTVFSSQLQLFPSDPTLGNFTKVFQAWPVLTWFGNSVVITVITTVLTVMFSTLAGYAFAKLCFPGANLLFLALLATMMIPAQATLVPLFRIVDRMGLIGTFWAVILPGAAGTFGVFLARQFMLAIPTEVIEAARIDGAGSVAIFLRIVLPLSKPLLAVLTLLSVMGQWNDFLWPLIVLRDPTLFTLPIGLQFLKGQYTTDYGAMMAMTLLSVAPLVILFLVFQRYFVQGLATTGIR